MNQLIGGLFALSAGACLHYSFYEVGAALAYNALYIGACGVVDYYMRREKDNIWHQH